MTKTSVIILDNIYDNPDEVRKMALGMDFNIVGNFPGKRTLPYINDDIRYKIEQAVKSQIINWGDKTSYSAAFQSCTAHSIKTWVHSDQFNNWAGVLYLTPKAPVNSGTVFFRHKASGVDREIDMPKDVIWDGRVPEQWEMTDRVANKYNRLVLYDATLFHCSESYFGEDLETGRLFQTFFFSTKDK